MGEQWTIKFRTFKCFWMAEPESKRKRIRKIKCFWMAEPGHPHEVGVLHNRPPAAGTHEASAKR